MRASEFILKENIFDKIGDWANKSVIGQKAKDRANVAKKNVPVIAKALHQILVSQAGKTPDEQMEKMITDTFSKALKVNVGKHQKKFGDSINKVVTAFTGSPASTKTDGMRNLIQDVVARSFKVADADTEFSMEDLIEKVATAVEGGADLTKTLTSALTQVGFAPSEIASLLREIEKALEKTDNTRKAMKAVLRDAKRGNSRSSADDEASPEAEPEDTATNIDEEFLDKFIDNVKEHLFRKQHKIDLRDPESVADFVEFNVNKHKEQLGITTPDQADKIVDDLLQDPDMAFNYEPEKKFTGLVYSMDGLKYQPGDIDGRNIVYVQDSGDEWSAWEMQSTTAWHFKEKVVDITFLKSLESLKGSMPSKVFRQDPTGGQTNMYKVSNR